MNKIHPIIILGMHRSGTSVLTRTLEKAGLFMGKKKDGNDEAEYFLRLNEFVFKIAGVRWENPTHLKYLMDDAKSFELVKEYLGRRMKQPMSINYLGVNNYIKYKSIYNIQDKWGWKDPRNIFTMKLWLSLFPLAKIVVIDRHGVDVADSLVRRNRIDHDAKEKWSNFRGSVYSSKCQSEKLVAHPRCASLSSAFEIWVEYMEESKRAVGMVKEGNVCRIKYEDFLVNPRHVLSELLEFCSLSATEKLVGSMIEELDPTRAYAYRHDCELVDFSKKVEHQLVSNGYFGGEAVK